MSTIKYFLWESKIKYKPAHTHTHTHIYIYINIYNLKKNPYIFTSK